MVPAAKRRDLRVAPRDPAEAVAIPAPVRAETPSVSAVRPGPGSDADRAWRNGFRSRVEGAAAASGEGTRTGTELTETVVLLARAGLFRLCTAEEIAELAATAYPMSFEAGDFLCEEGAESLECYVVEEGEADVTIDGAFVRQIEANDVVGERGPLEGLARSATVRATSHMNTVAISRERLRELVERSPTAREGMFAWMRERYPD